MSFRCDLPCTTLRADGFSRCTAINCNTFRRRYISCGAQGALTSRLSKKQLDAAGVVVEVLVTWSSRNVGSVTNGVQAVIGGDLCVRTKEMQRPAVVLVVKRFESYGATRDAATECPRWKAVNAPVLLLFRLKMQQNQNKTV